MFPVKVWYRALVSTMRGVVALLVMCHLYEHAYNSLETCFRRPNGMWAGPLFGVTVKWGQSGDYPQRVLKFNVVGVSKRKPDSVGIRGVWQ